MGSAGLQSCLEAAHGRSKDLRYSERPGVAQDFSPARHRRYTEKTLARVIRIAERLTDMKKLGSEISGEKGFVLVYMAGALTVLLLFTGVAVDSGRAYVVKAQLTKAVDGAALAAARSLNSANPRAEAAKIYRANFPAGYMGTTSSTDPADAGFFSTDRRCRQRHQCGERFRDGRAADHVHEDRQFQRSHREQRRAGHATDGGPLPRDGRLELDRMEMALRQRLGQGVRECVRSEQRSSVPRVFRQWRQCDRCHALHPWVCEGYAS